MFIFDRVLAEGISISIILQTIKIGKHGNLKTTLQQQTFMPGRTRQGSGTAEVHTCTTARPSGPKTTQAQNNNKNVDSRPGSQLDLQLDPTRTHTPPSQCYCASKFEAGPYKEVGTLCLKLPGFLNEQHLGSYLSSILAFGC